MKKHPFPNLHPKVIEDAKKKLDELDKRFSFSGGVSTQATPDLWKTIPEEDVKKLEEKLRSNLATNFPSVASRMKANERSSQDRVFKERAALNQNPFKK